MYQTLFCDFEEKWAC